MKWAAAMLCLMFVGLAISASYDMGAFNGSKHGFEQGVKRGKLEVYDKYLEVTGSCVDAAKPDDIWFNYALCLNDRFYYEGNK